VIATRGIGNHTVNDPLRKALNGHLLSGKEVIWADFWRDIGSGLAGNPRFADYVPPDKNASLLFPQAYRAVTGDRRPALPPAKPLELGRVVRPQCELSC
jgi:hypothetical protein